MPHRVDRRPWGDIQQTRFKKCSRSCTYSTYSTFMKERRLFTAATIYYTVDPNISLTLRQCSLLCVATMYADKQVINQRSYRNSVYLQFENHCLFISSAFLLPSHPFISLFSHSRSLACMHTKTLKCARELACLRIKLFFSLSSCPTLQ